MLRRFPLALCMLLVVFLPVTTGCVQCTKIGCFNGIWVTSPAGEGVRAVGLCVGSNCLDGGGFPSGPSVRTPGCDPAVSCRLFFAFDPGKASKATVKVIAPTATGPGLQFERVITFKGVHINGKHCGSACKQATLDLAA